VTGKIISVCNQPPWLTQSVGPPSWEPANNNSVFTVHNDVDLRTSPMFSI